MNLSLGLQPHVTSTDRSFRGSGELNAMLEQARQARIVRDQRMSERIAAEQQRAASRQQDHMRRVELFNMEQKARSDRAAEERRFKSQQKAAERERQAQDPVHKAKVAEAEQQLQSLSPEGQRRIAQEEARKRALQDREYALRARRADLWERQLEGRGRSSSSYEQRLERRAEREYRRRFVERSQVRMSEESGLPETTFVVIDKTTGQPVDYDQARTIAEEAARAAVVNDDGFPTPAPAMGEATGISYAPMEAPAAEEAAGPLSRTELVGQMLGELGQDYGEYQEFLAMPQEEKDAYLEYYIAAQAGELE